MNSRSGYVLAGFETLAGIVNNFFLNTKGRFFDNFTRDEISNFLSTVGSGYLHSFGENFCKKKKYNTYNQLEANMYTRIRDTGLFNNATFIADSGGFQIAIGRMSRTESELLLKLYYEFLETHHPVLEKAFILDIPPGDNCAVLKDFDDLKRWNSISYERAANLPDDIRSKIIYIHHFRSPKLYNIFDDILKSNDYFSRFNYFGTGGIVASMTGDNEIPCIIYTVPMIPIINQAIAHKRTKLDFHVLGGANFRDILFYELFQKHVYIKHGIELKITYDSAGMYKGLMRGRFLNVLSGDSVCKMDVRSEGLDQRFYQNQTIKEKYLETLNEMAIRNGFKKLDITEIYNKETDTFWEEIRVYSMLFCLDIYAVLQERLKKFTDDIYPLYELGDYETFSTEVHKMTQLLNDGKITRKQKAKSNSLIKSLDMLTNLDEDYCKHIVDKCLSKDEFKNLIKNSSQLLSI